MKILNWILFIGYLLLVSYIVFFARRRHGIVWSEDYLNIVPIKRMVESYRSPDVKRWDFYSNLFGNILLFIPLTVFAKGLFSISDKNVIVLGCAISLSIEIIQYLMRIGVADIDDVFLNTFGVIIGVVIWNVLSRLYVYFR